MPIDLSIVNPPEVQDQTLNTNLSVRREKRRKIRRLMSEARKNESIANATAAKNKRFKVWALKIVLIVVFSALLVPLYDFQFGDGRRTGLVVDFVRNYRRQVNQIVHGQEDYCDLPLDTRALFAKIERRQILHQEWALRRLEEALQNTTGLKSVALVGPSGVGKSLFALALQEDFQWPELVHSYAWNTYVQEEAEKFHVVRMLLEKLSDCGCNLIVIENLSPADIGVVDILNQVLAGGEGDEEILRKRVVLLYVFNLNAMPDNLSYKRERQMLQHLTKTTTINFRSFGAEEVRACIEREARLEDRNLSEADYDEVVRTINASQSGCKNVRAKVLAIDTVATKE